MSKAWHGWLCRVELVELALCDFIVI